MRVPVSVPAGNPYELTKTNLEDMWDKHADCYLQNTTLKVKQNVVLIKGKRWGSILNPNFQYLCM
jgi:hypothetical protein